MLLTAELRWFNRGTLPEEISHWFQQDCLGDHLAPPEEREDLYLYIPGCDYMNVKLRQGRLEIKWRKAELGVVRFEDRVEGKAETWGKWLCEDPTSDFQLAAVRGKESWVSVQKVRFLRKASLTQRQYQVFPDKSITLPVTESIDQGCNVELTTLTINNNAWWSLAFEAFGEHERLMDHLQTLANQVFKTYHGPKLLVEDSFAYPSWLSVVMPVSRSTNL